MKKIIASIIIIFMIFQTASALTTGAEEVEMNKKHYGLHVEENGDITLEGEKFYGFGVNYFGAFVRYVDRQEPDRMDFVQAFKELHDYNIPFIRMPLCSFYPTYYDLYDSDPELVFRYMDKVVDEAYKNGLGIIASLMWYDPSVAAHVGEKRAYMGKEGSKTLEYSKEYTAAIVKRYADHPAVWGWEIGNEYNLNADLCDKDLKNFLWYQNAPGLPLENLSGFDYYTSAELQYFYSEIAKVIRKYDKYRMITTGNGEMRPFAHSLWEGSQKVNKKHFWTLKWDSDTREEFDEMNEFFTPDPIDTLCFHLQQGSADGSKTYVMEFDRFGQHITDEEYYKAYYDVSRKLKKGCFFGEFGDFLEMETDEKCLENFKKTVTAIENSGIQIAALWQFQDYTNEGISGEKLAALSETNAALKEAGSQKTDKAWEEHTEPATAAPETEPQTEKQTEKDTEKATETKEIAPEPENKTNLIPVIAAVAAAAAIAAAIIFVIKKRKNK